MSDFVNHFHDAVATPLPGISCSNRCTVRNRVHQVMFETKLTLPMYNVRWIGLRYARGEITRKISCELAHILSPCLNPSIGIPYFSAPIFPLAIFIDVTEYEDGCLLFRRDTQGDVFVPEIRSRNVASCRCYQESRPICVIDKNQILRSPRGVITSRVSSLRSYFIAALISSFSLPNLGAGDFHGPTVDRQFFPVLQLRCQVHER